MSKCKTVFFAMRLRKSTIRELKRQKRGTADSFLSDLLRRNNDIMSREPVQKASQTAQKALRRASKRGVMVRDGGAE